MGRLESPAPCAKARFGGVSLQICYGFSTDVLPKRIGRSHTNLGAEQLLLALPTDRILGSSNLMFRSFWKRRPSVNCVYKSNSHRVNSAAGGDVYVNCFICLKLFGNIRKARRILSAARSASASVPAPHLPFRVPTPDAARPACPHYSWSFLNIFYV